jgi:hypothetical protein
MGTVSLPGVKRWGVLLTTHTHLAIRLRNEYIYISTPNSGLRDLYWGKLYLTGF